MVVTSCMHPGAVMCAGPAAEVWGQSLLPAWSLSWDILDTPPPDRKLRALNPNGTTWAWLWGRGKCSP